MNIDHLLSDYNEYEQANRCTVSIKTARWADSRGLHEKKRITFLRRKCRGFNILEEDAGAIGAEGVISRITNLHSVPDGVYTVIECNEQRDNETGNIEDYDYMLVAVDEEEEDAQ